MAVAQLNTSTLSSAIAAGDNDFAVGSTSNISVGNLLVLAGTGGLETLKVQAIPVSGRVQVLRGYDGSRARAHASGTRFFIGTPDTFKSIRNSLLDTLGLVGDSGNFPDYLLPGARARDGAGNEYVLVDLQGTYYSGTTVLIDSAHDGTFFAVPLTGGSQGSVGVLVEEGTSNQYAWAQIYGYNAYAQDSTVTSAATSAYHPIAATSVSTPDVGLAVTAMTSTATQVFLIEGMFITGAATTATTSATSATGVAVPVWLDYPYVKGIRTDIGLTS